MGPARVLFDTETRTGGGYAFERNDSSLSLIFETVEKVAAGAVCKKRCAGLLPYYQWMSDIARRDRARREMQCILRCKRGTR
jgi:hypothetical protein